jgi:D-alanyl-D-alanine dipeptidase
MSPRSARGKGPMQKWQLILAIILTGLGLSGPQTADAQVLSAQALPGGFVYRGN